MLKKVLIANRGEIAVRIIQACKELGIKTVAVYSPADKKSMHVFLADEAYDIGNNAATDSYLNIPAIIEVAKITGCDGIHPGYGFLSENTHFAEECVSEKIKLVGPSLENMKLMGNKLAAKLIAKQCGVPVLEGCESPIKSVNDLENSLKDMTFPVILKASFGGGGKGIKVCNSFNDAKENYQIAAKEAKSDFGNSEIYVEQYVPSFRHIEVQVLEDQQGKCICLGERNCTIQRHMQKMIEESPSPLLPEYIRKKMHDVSIKLAQKINFEGAGTIEYLYDYKNARFYFMEMNTRIQVEHPVSEAVSNIDLVKEQLLIASGVGLTPLQAGEVITDGFAIECRITAEDTDHNFMPSLEKITLFLPPTGIFQVRTDSFIYSGYQIVPYYDSLLAKVIVKGKTRAEAIQKMKVALNSTLIEGPKTSLSFLQLIINTDEFKGGTYDNNFISKLLKKKE